MAYSATTVLPLDVGAETRRPLLASSFSAASTWKGSSGQGSDAWNSAIRLWVSVAMGPSLAIARSGEAAVAVEDLAA
jgi:hypothetical protein